MIHQLPASARFSIAALLVLGMLLSACGGSGVANTTTQAKPHNPPTLTTAKMAQWHALANDDNGVDYSNVAWPAGLLAQQSFLVLTTDQLTGVLDRISPPGQSSRTVLGPHADGVACSNGLDCTFAWSGSYEAEIQVDTKPSPYPLDQSGYFMHYTAPSHDPNTISPKTLRATILANLAGNPTPTTQVQVAYNYSKSTR